MSKIDITKLHASISIEPVKGGFILGYPVQNGESVDYTREVVPTQRKAIQRLKEVLDTFSTDEVAETKE